MTWEKMCWPNRYKFRRFCILFSLNTFPSQFNSLRLWGYAIYLSPTSHNEKLISKTFLRWTIYVKSKTCLVIDAPICSNFKAKMLQWHCTINFYKATNIQSSKIRGGLNILVAVKFINWDIKCVHWWQHVL